MKIEGICQQQIYCTRNIKRILQKDNDIGQNLDLHKEKKSIKEEHMKVKNKIFYFAYKQLL